MDENTKLVYERVAIQSPEHLKRWLAATGRNFITFSSKDLVDSLEQFEHGVVLLQNLVNCYRAHRNCQPTGESPDGTLTYKTDVLTLSELDRAIREMIRQAKDLDPNWSLDSDPL
jgi:hypothetical protein